MSLKCSIRVVRNSSVQPLTKRVGTTSSLLKHVKHALGCDCPVCTRYASGRFKLAGPATARKSLLQYPLPPSNSSDFPWLLDQLSNLQELNVGLPLKIPETTVWKDGIPKYILRFSNNKFTKLFTKKMTPHFVLTNFGDKGPEPTTTVPGSSESRRKSSSVYRAVSPKSPTTIPEYHNYKAILRECSEDDPHKLVTKLLCEKDLFNVLSTWTRDQLKKIQLLQTYTKLTGGKSSVIRFHMMSPLTSPQSSGNNSPSIRGRTEVCKEICRRICKTLFASYEIEVQELSAEFMTTDTEYLLHDAWEIVWRKKQQPLPPKPDYTPYVVNRDSFEKLVTQLGRREETGKRDTIVKLNNLCETMDKHIKNIRENTGVDSGMAKESPDNTSNVAFAELRPRCPYRMAELLQPEFDIRKVPSKNLTPEARRLPRKKLVRAMLFEENQVRVRMFRNHVAGSDTSKGTAAHMRTFGEGAFATTRESTEKNTIDLAVERANKRRRGMSMGTSYWTRPRIGPQRCYRTSNHA